MKDSIVGVEEKLRNLDTSMSKINNLATVIDDNLKVKRNEINKLDTINKELGKLDNLCQLPRILKKDLQQYKEELASG